MIFDIVPSIHNLPWEHELQVVEEGLRVFEGNRYQCNLYIQARLEGWDIETATMGAKKSERP